MVTNTNPQGNSALNYEVFFKDGVPYFFTLWEMERAEYRAKQNPEDVPTDVKDAKEKGLLVDAFVSILKQLTEAK